MIESVFTPQTAMLPQKAWRSTRDAASANDNSEFPLKPSARGTDLARRSDPQDADRPAVSHAVRAVVKMKREGNGAVSLHISDIEIDQTARIFGIAPLNASLERSAACPVGEGLRRQSDGPELAVAAVGEFQRDGASMALVFRFLAAPRDTRPSPENRAVQCLPKWRLKRATDYIEANLGEPISLSGLAGAAGLSPAYFAAQFRATTGLRPHEYLLRRRIREAQRMLLDPQLTLVDIALSVGFQTQAHFTTVFKRFVGDTPCHWRRQNYADA